MNKVLFVCGENSARSQMAEGLFNHMARTWKAESVGTAPGPQVNPLAVEAMAELGLDISGSKPRALELERLDGFQRIISFGCIVESAFPARDRLEEWPLEDPGQGDLALMRRVRDDIEQRVAQLLSELEDQPDG